MPALGWGKKVPEAQLMRVGGWEVKRALKTGQSTPHLYLFPPAALLWKRALSPLTPPHKKKLIEVSLL
jgi:hypothetical protein